MAGPSSNSTSTASLLSDMKTCTCCKEVKPVDLFGPYKRSKDGLFSHCRECVRKRASAYRNTPEGRAREAAYTKANLQRIYARRKAKRDADPEAAQAASRAYYLKRRDEFLAKQRERYWSNIDASRAYQTEYRKARPALARLWYSERRLAKTAATPAWADPKEILAAYEAADLLMQITGEWYEVDHVIPLRGAIARQHVVCGLHVGYNLQVIPKIENRRKSNVFWPDMPA
jgi:hypothetical protein